MPYETLDPAGARERLDGDDAWTYVDVRTEEEYVASHVPGAFNVPVLFRGSMGMEPNPDFVAVIQKHFPTDARLVLGCAAGIRSERACQLLEAEGYKELVTMDGGFSGRRDRMTGEVHVEGWTDLGYPTTAEPQDERTYASLR